MASSAFGPFTRDMAEWILSANMDPIRFESFCVDLFTELDSLYYVPTSLSWDLGRDGRPIAMIAREDTPFICCSLRADVPEKIVEDLERLQENAEVTALRFCSSQKVSEQGREGIKNV